jgi:hypothetical protein
MTSSIATITKTITITRRRRRRRNNMLQRLASHVFMAHIHTLVFDFS